MATVSPYGSWQSPFTPDSLVDRMVRLSDVKLVNEEVYWVEMRPRKRAAVPSCAGMGGARTKI